MARGREERRARGAPASPSVPVPATAWFQVAGADDQHVGADGAEDVVLDQGDEGMVGTERGDGG